MVAEYNASGAVANRYVHGPGVDAPIAWYENAGVDASTRRLLLADERGSIIAVTDGLSNMHTRNTYDEYGIPGETNQGRFQYTGQIWLPSLGMYHYKARAYSPTLGRFMQTDPIGYDDQFNLYAYLGNDPLNDTDPTGLQCYLCFEERTRNRDGTVNLRSNELFRMVVPGQVAWDDARTNWANGNPGTAIANGVVGVVEQAATVLSGGAGRAYFQGTRIVGQHSANIIPVLRREIGQLESSSRSYAARAERHLQDAASLRANPTVRPGMEGQSSARIAAQQQRRIQGLERDGQMFQERSRQAHQRAQDLRKLIE